MVGHLAGDREEVRSRARLARWAWRRRRGGGGPSGLSPPCTNLRKAAGEQASGWAGERVSGRIAKTDRIYQTNEQYMARSSSQGGPLGSTSGCERERLGAK